MLKLVLIVNSPLTPFKLEIYLDIGANENDEGDVVVKKRIDDLERK